jgi:pimeloyl-ACP methyl ester carboxylesterase
MTTQPATATIAGAEHHTADVNGTTLHYVSAGDGGSPILLVHGFPETWWAFRTLIPLLARQHRVYATDLRGFGDSGNAAGDYGAAASAEDLHQLIGNLAAGPMHVLGQDISGGVVYRLAATHPEDVLSLTAVETGLAGFGAEGLADVSRGGAWYIGALAAPGIAELLFAGREHEFIAGYLYPSYGAVAPAVTAADTAEFVRTYARPQGLRGAVGLYRSMLRDGEEMRALAAASPLSMPVLAIGSSGGPFTASALRQVSAAEISATELAGVGHYVAQEAPGQLAERMLAFLGRLDPPAGATPGC